jgi:hypothetical protein
MTTWMKIALVLNILGTIGVGVIPIVGRIAGPGGGVAFCSNGGRGGWGVAWFVFLVGIALGAAAR